MKIERISIPEYEEVYFCSDPASELRAYIAVHSTRLGPSLGGIRLWNYHSDQEALNDVLRLAKAMTYKAASAGLNLGGGKAVIIANPDAPKSEKMLRAMGKFIDSLQGRFLAAEDARMSPEDLDIIGKETPYVTGTRKGSGDPSPVTAEGVFLGIKVCIQEAIGDVPLSGLSVACQGAGHVGYHLIRLLSKAGMRITVSEINQKLLEKCRKDFHVQTVPPEEILNVRSDIFSPCALGHVLNQDNIPSIGFRIIAGAANNQLEHEERNDALLFERNILYAPDYVINAGGLIHIYVRDILHQKDSGPWLDLIPKNLREIFAISKREKIPPGKAANRLAEERLRLGPTK